MTAWRLIDSGPCAAAYNMALDEALATCVRRGLSGPVLRLYGWERPSLSLGLFQSVSDIDEEYCSRSNIPVVRRPTGGRAILHGDELTYSFSSRNEDRFSHGLLETYRQLSLAFASALDMAGVSAVIKKERESGSNLTKSPLCFRSVSYGEISVNKEKLIGSAQKRWIDGFLQQGSLPYSYDYDALAAVFRLNSAEVRKHGSTEETTGDREAGSAGGLSGLRGLSAGFDPDGFKRNVRAAFERNFGVTLAESHPSAREQELALQLSEEKYSDVRWTREVKQETRFCNSRGTPKR